MKNRAYSLLSIKAVNEDQREITGIASTPETDRMGDVVEPDGAEYKLPIPLLWQHDDEQPIGEIYAATATKNGIEIKARVKKASESVTLMQRLDEAWESIKIGLVKGLSIGFKPIEYAFLDDGGLHFQKWEWLELSAVTIPANISATITSIKSFDAQARAAMGAKGKAKKADTPSGASEKKPTPTVKLTPKEGNKMKISEQIKQYQNERAAKTAKMEAIMKASADAGETLPEDKAEEYDTLEKEVDKIDKHLDRLESLQKAQARNAAPVVEVETTEDAAEQRRNKGPTIILQKNKEDAFQGQSFTRMVIAKALAAKNPGASPAAIAEKRWGKTNPKLIEFIKANEVDAGGEAGGAWGSQLVQPVPYTADFIELLNASTVFDKLGLTTIPANVTIMGQDGAATGYFVGEGKGIPMSKPDFTDVTLTPLKAAAITTVSNDLIRNASVDAEMIIRNSLIEATAQKIDTVFLGSAAASAGVYPAGMLYGVAADHTVGNDGEGLRADVKALYAHFIAAFNAKGLTFVMNPALAKAIQLMVNALGQTEFPGITADGGTLLGDPVVTGDNVGATDLILLKPRDIYRIGDLGLQVSVSQEATIEQSSVPAGAALTHTAASANLQNTFQQELTAIKIVRPINFAKRRSSAVAYIDDAAYGSTESA